MIDKHTLAYIAGYTDGDGCFHIRKTLHKTTGKPKYSCSFIISSTDSGIIEYLTKIFPGKRRLADNRLKFKVQKPQFHFTIRGKQSLNLVESIVPYLVEKRPEADLYCRFIKSSDNMVKEQLMNSLKNIKEYSNLINETDKSRLMAIRNIIIPHEIDFAYLAGFIDAECSLGIFRYNQKDKPNFIYKILLQCGNTKLPIFSWLLERFGGQVHFIDKQSKDINHRNVLSWRLSSKSLGLILPKIQPFLKYKQPVCAHLMKFYETNTPIEGNISRNSPKFREFYQSILDVRDVLFHKVHELNRRGI